MSALRTRDLYTLLFFWRQDDGAAGTRHSLPNSVFNHTLLGGVPPPEGNNALHVQCARTPAKRHQSRSSHLKKHPRRLLERLIFTPAPRCAFIPASPGLAFSRLGVENNYQRGKKKRNMRKRSDGKKNKYVWERRAARC